jgi:hypothetical protein
MHGQVNVFDGLLCHPDRKLSNLNRVGHP